jgi:hypothetical protein
MQHFGAHNIREMHHLTTPTHTQCEMPDIGPRRKEGLEQSTPTPVVIAYWPDGGRSEPGGVEVVLALDHTVHQRHLPVND